MENWSTPKTMLEQREQSVFLRYVQTTMVLVNIVACRLGAGDQEN
jgi:hypothetical protein